MIAGIITWLLKGWLSRWALTAEGEIKDGWRWLVSSLVHALMAVCAVLTVIAWLGWHERDVKARQVARLTAENAKWRADLDADAGTIRDQQAAIARQNIAVMALGKASAAAQMAGAKADDAALARSAQRGAEAHAIASMPALPAVASCRTPAPVLAAKGDL